MSRLLAVLRALLAAMVLAALLVGLPWLLWTLGGSLLPPEMPTLADLRALLTTPDDGRVFLAGLTLVGLLGWVMFTVSVLVEIPAALARRPAIRLPGLGLTQLAAASLVGAIVTGLGTSTAAAASVPAADVVATSTAIPTPSASAAAAVDDEVDEPDVPSGPLYTVRDRDTLWEIAETHLGDGLRYREIVELNRDRVQPDGEVLTDASILRAGWTLQLPPDADLPTSVTVADGDTLRELAEQRYGDPTAWERVFEANAGRPQPDGGALQDPDVIRPGWVLQLPPDAARPDSPDPPPAEPTMPEQPTAAPQPQEPTTPPQPPPTVTALPEQDPATATSPPDTTAPSASEPSTAPVSAAGEPADERYGQQATNDDVVTLPTALTVSALLAGSALSGVALARRRQQRRRRGGRQVATPNPGSARLERAYRAAAPRADVTWLDLALRSLAAALAARPSSHDEGPDILGAWLGPEQLRLILAQPCPRAFTPFAATSDGLEWVLPIDAELPVTTGTAGQHLAPLPALASVAHAGEEQLLLDLERLGALEISGHPERGRSLLRHLAAELANNTWSDHLDVVLVGFGAEITALNPDRIRHLPDRAQAVDHLRRRLTRAQHALDDLQPGSVLDGRVHDVAGDAWMPEVLLVSDEDHAGADDRAELDALLVDISRAGRATVAVVATTRHRNDDPEYGWRAHIDADGTLHLPQLTTQELRAEGIPAELVPHLVELFAVTAAADEPIPAADDPNPWAHGMDAAGSLLPNPTAPTDIEDTTNRPDEDRADAQHHVPTTAHDTERPKSDSDLEDFELDDGPELEVPLNEDLDDTDQRLVEIHPAARVAGDALDRVEQLDPDLDTDLATYQRTDPTRPLISILGEPQVRAPGETPRHRVPWYTEILVYLALHPHGVTTDQLMTDLWPEGHAVSPVTLRQALSTARKWAGTTPAGEPHVPDKSRDGLYRLHGHLLDWDLFRRLRKRAEARRAAGHHGARDDYLAALKLAHGPVLHPQRPRGYTWLAEPDQQHELLIPGHIIDTAHALVELALTEDDHALAHQAVQVALLVDRDRTSERPLVDQMRVLHAQGNLAEAERAAAQLLTLTEVDVPEELQPDTFRAVNELFPQGVRAS